MIVYVEFVLLQTIIINFCLLKLVKITTKNQSTFFKIFLASCFGALCHLIAIRLISNKIVLNLIEFIATCVMLKICFKINFKQHIYSLILMYIFSFSLSGFAIAINSRTYYTTFGTVTTTKFNIDAICLLIILATYIYELVLNHIKTRISTSSLIYNIKLTHKNKHIKIQAFLDTGNCLNFNGNPVIVLDLFSFLKLYNYDLINFLKQNANVLSTSTVNGTSNLKIFKIDKIEIYNKNKTIKHFDQYVAVNTNDCFKNNNYKALISPMFI